MAIPLNFIKTLRVYGETSDVNKAKLSLALDDAMEDLISNKGGSVSSASANGASFSMRPDGMTNAEWMSCLSTAIDMINKGVKSTGISHGIII